MAKQIKPAIGYRVDIRGDGQYSEFRHLHVEVMLLDRHDAMDDVREYFGSPSLDSKIAAAKQIVDASGGSVYYRETVDSRHNSFSFTYQDDRDTRPKGRWYAFRVEVIPAANLLALVGKIAKAAGDNADDIAPRDLIGILDKMGAVPVKYINGSCGTYVRDRDFDIEKEIPLPPKPEAPADQDEIRAAAEAATA
jgi:hypothetical protein